MRRQRRPRAVLTEAKDDIAHNLRGPSALVLPFALLTSLTLSADLRVGPEVAVTPPEVSVLNDREGGDVASDGDGFLVVYSSVDAASGECYTSSDIRASRLNARGENLDPNGFAVAADAIREELPTVIHCGISYVIGWAQTDGYYISRVGTDRSISPRRRIGGRDFQRLACDRGKLVLAERSSAMSELRVTFHDASDRPIATITIESHDTLVATASRDGSTLVIQHRWLAGAYETRAVVVRDSRPVQEVSLGTDLGWVRDIQTGARTFLVSAMSSNTMHGIVLALFDRDDFRLLRRIELLDARLMASLVQRDGGYVAYAKRASGLVQISLSEGGETDTRVLRSIDEEVGAAATNGSEDIVLLGRQRLSRIDVLWDLVALRASDAAIQPIGFAARAQRQPALACAGGKCLALWSEDRLDAYGDRIMSRPFDLSGKPLDEAREISLPYPDLRDLERAWPSVAFDGVNYLTVWQERRNWSVAIVGRRLSSDGAPFGDQLNISDIGVLTFLPPIRLVWGAGTYVLAWGNGEANFTFLSPAGELVRTIAPPLSAEVVYRGQPDVAWDGETFVAAWVDVIRLRVPCGRYCNLPSRVSEGRFTADGAFLDVRPLMAELAWPQSAGTPRVAAGSGHHFVVWNEWRGGRSHLIGRIGHEDGTLPDPFEITASPAEFPAVSWDGSRYAVAWADWGESPSNLLVDRRTDIHFTRIEPHGHRDSEARVISNSPAAEFPPVLASAEKDQMLIAYKRIASDDENGGAGRVFLRSIQSAARQRAARP